MSNSAGIYVNNSTQRSSAPAAGIIIFIYLECLVITQGFLAFRDHFFTLSQMRSRGIDQGLPFLWHFAMWGDLFVISGIAAYLVGRYCGGWRIRSILASHAIGFAAASFLSWLYTLSGVPEAHIQNHQLTAAGIVHLLYMAFAIAISIQFLLFTDCISTSLLRTVSVLLCLHVFAGTHMVLGIVNAIHPFDWYPGKPLQSLFGWSTVATVVLALVWRNLGNTKVISAMRRLAQWLYDFVMFWFGGLAERVRSTAGYLEFLNLICGLVGFGWFFNVIRLRLHESQLLGDGHWWLFVVSSDGLSLFLVLFFGFIYFLSRQSAKRELVIGRMLFPPKRIPDEWKVQDRFWVTVQVILFLGTYMVLAWSTKYIVVSSALMFVIACFDLNTRRKINNDMEKYLFDEKYAPRADESDFSVIEDRRKIARWYLFELPHLKKEGVRIAGCGIASCVAILGHVKGSVILDTVAYVLLIVTLIGNEVVTLSWRHERERRLRAVG